MKKLNEEEINAALHELSSWKRVEGDKISLEVRLSDFRQTFALMTEIALYAEKVNHHPEWSNTYNFLKVALTTHDAGGLTQLDLDMAKFISQALQKRESL